MVDEKIGVISHFFSKISVAVVELDNTIKVGDKIHIKGHTTDIKMAIKSMQIEHDSVQKAESGQSIGLKVPDAVRAGDIVYKE